MRQNPIDGNEIGSVKVYTSTGVFVQEETISNGTIQFNVNGKTGLYFVEVTSNNKKSVFKIIKY